MSQNVQYANSASRPKPTDELTPAQASRLTGIEKQIIIDAVNSGVLPSTVVLRRITLIRAEDIEKWFSAQTAADTKARVK
jgi:excisionase family DNA binding protein